MKFSKNWFGKVDPEKEFRDEMKGVHTADKMSLEDVIGHMPFLSSGWSKTEADQTSVVKIYTSMFQERWYSGEHGKDAVLDYLKKAYPDMFQKAVDCFGELNFTQCVLCKCWYDYSTLEENDPNPIDRDGLCYECHGNTKPGRLINKPPEEEVVPGDFSDQMYDQARDDEAMAEARLEAKGMFPTPLGRELDGINTFLDRP